MDRLKADPIVRLTAQVVLLLTIGGMTLVLLSFDVATVARGAFNLSSGSLLAISAFLKVMSFPFKETFAPFLVLFTGLTPMALVSVCFEVGDQGVTSDKLNPVGHAAFICLIAGLAVGLVALVLLAAYEGPITASVGADRHPAIQGFVTTLVGFEASLLAQLLGFKSK